MWGCVIRYISVFVTKLCFVVVAKFTKFKKFSKFYPLPRNIISLKIYAKTFLHNLTFLILHVVINMLKINYLC